MPAVARCGVAGLGAVESTTKCAGGGGGELGIPRAPAGRDDCESGSGVCAGVPKTVAQDVVSDWVACAGVKYLEAVPAKVPLI